MNKLQKGKLGLLLVNSVIIQFPTYLISDRSRKQCRGILLLELDSTTTLVTEQLALRAEVSKLKYQCLCTRHYITEAIITEWVLFQSCWHSKCADGNGLSSVKPKKARGSMRITRPIRFVTSLLQNQISRSKIFPLKLANLVVQLIFFSFTDTKG